MTFSVIKKIVQRKGIARLGWHLGHGFVQQEITVRSEVWCVVGQGAKRPIAQCPTEETANRVADALNGKQ